MKTGNMIALLITTLGLTGVADAQDITVHMNKVNDTGVADSIGIIVIRQTAHGLEFIPDLTGLDPGKHGFHMHKSGNCEPAENEDGKLSAAMAAEGHYDPEGNEQHGSPLDDVGHMGDLPVLVADATGYVGTSVASTRLGEEDLENRALIIHVGGDNYSDIPEPLGGGGARFACGIIKI